MTASDRSIRTNQDRERKLIALALYVWPRRAEDERALLLSGEWERERVANAERLAAFARRGRGDAEILT